MCTLVFGLDVAGPGTLVAGANRDERPERPTAPPGRLADTPRLAGGRDLVSGGTWLAIRERHAAVAMLNRRPRPGRASDPAGPRSRGLLAIDIAAAPLAGRGAAPEPLIAYATDALASAAYASFSLVYLAPAATWVMVHEPGEPVRILRPTAGWHVLAHAELDDPDELRTASLGRAIADWHPAGWDEARSGLAAWLADHGERVAAPVCIHDGPMPTVSSSIVMLSPGGLRYAHREGRPCEGPFADRSDLLVPAATGRATPMKGVSE